jgi:hypothetical protein
MTSKVPNLFTNELSDNLFNFTEISIGFNSSLGYFLNILFIWY